VSAPAGAPSSSSILCGLSSDAGYGCIAPSSSPRSPVGSARRSSTESRTQYPVMTCSNLARCKRARVIGVHVDAHAIRERREAR
jgi:hypothetical protein